MRERPATRRQPSSRLQLHASSTAIRIYPHHWTTNCCRLEVAAAHATPGLKNQNFNTRTYYRRIVSFFVGVITTRTRENQKEERNDMTLDTLQKLYVDELRDLYNAENQLLKALPKMAKAVSSEELKNAFEKHLEQTETHVERLEDIFQELDQNPKGKTCHGMKGLVEEGSEILKEDGDPSVLDAGIIVAAQKVEHYEIAGYGSVRTFAGLLGQKKAAELLQTTLDEESEANELLNGLAESIVNPEALIESELTGVGRTN